MLHTFRLRQIAKHLDPRQVPDRGGEFPWKFGAGEGNRTLVFSLEGCCSTIELHPRDPLMPIRRSRVNGAKAGAAGSVTEKTAALATPQLGIKPSRAKSSAWEPSSTIPPLSSTINRSRCAMVESRCAMASVVRPRISPVISCWIAASTSLSSALVASSSTRIGASSRITRAMAMRWRWPPDSFTPRSPTCAAKPRAPFWSANPSMKLSACARRAASRSSSWRASGRP